MAEQVAGQLKIDITNEQTVPPIAAVFLVNFDHRKGCAQANFALDIY
jgi:hypothetical protein